MLPAKRQSEIDIHEKLSRVWILWKMIDELQKV